VLRRMKWRLGLRNGLDIWRLWRAGTNEPCKIARKPGKRQRHSQVVTSSLHKLAIATKKNLWEIKLAHRPKSFWYPTQHCTALRSSKSFPPRPDFICWTSAEARTARWQTSESPMET
jgi:hypothetical protein